MTVSRRNFVKVVSGGLMAGLTLPFPA